MTTHHLPLKFYKKSLIRWSITLMLIALAVVIAGCESGMPNAAPQFVYDPQAPANPPDRPELTLNENDRILVLAPHPDDEVLATGGVVQQAVAKGIPVQVVFLTNGDNNEFTNMFFTKAFTLDSSGSIYAGQVRAFEALRAGRELGLDISEETFLGYPDFGTLEIWENRWGDSEAFRSMFTEQSQVPYWFARTPDAPYKGESILTDLEAVLADFKPTKIFVSHPADTNQDHIALNLFLRTALWDLKDKVKPEIYSYLTHYGEWPQPRGLLFDAPLEPAAQFDEPGRWVTLPLEPEQTKQKLEAIKQHKTQFSASKNYLESYIRTNELFDPIKDIPLAPGGDGMQLLPSGTGVAAGSELPAGSQSDGATRRVRLEGDQLVFTVTLDPSSAAAVETDLYAFGYRSDKPFGEMPKIHVVANGSNQKVSERKQSLPPDSVQVSRNPGEIELRIPLSLLENPERIFLTAETNAKGTSLNPLPWVVLDLTGTK
jgi:LmbE family N-acetylglucosaminyl deacetylase